MAIRPRKIVYVTDRGHEFVVAEMTATHLVNTLTHIRRQIETIADIPQYLSYIDATHLSARVKMLEESYIVLVEELASRDPAKDEEYENEHCTDGRMW